MAWEEYLIQMIMDHLQRINEYGCQSVTDSETIHRRLSVPKDKQHSGEPNIGDWCWYILGRLGG